MGDLLEFMLIFAPIAAVAGLAFHLVRSRKSRVQSTGHSQADSGLETSGERLLHDEKLRLEERVRVLERIVTDRSYSLEQEIEALRGKPAAAGDTEKM
ncbi:hypothetical protein ACRAQ7_07960 [Erythrobacter sp. W53]|uniref:hypothetical protein n=1 Tax=Erythrobacteraceae TaxID=335929 RepID=UPI0036D41FC4